MHDVKGERLRQLRTARGLTQQELSNATGGLVTKQSISKYERGKSQPSPQVLRALADAFGVKTADLFRPPVANIEFAAYRKDSGLRKRKQEQVESLVTRKLEKRLRLQDLLGQVRDIDIPAEHWSVSSLDDAEQAAEDLRNRWYLGHDPIANVVDVLEDRHVYVIPIDAPDSFDGISALAYDDTLVAAAVVCQKDRPGERQRLNLTHELGHLVLDVDTTDDFTEEDAAFRFGAALLVPAEALRRDVGRRRRTIQLQELLLLKRHYGMSLRALLYRMRDLDIISEHHYRQWCIQINKQGWKTSEPEELEPERPTWFRRGVLRAYSEELLSKDDAQQMLGEEIDDEGETSALQQRREFMDRPLEERRKIMAQQAEELKHHYEDTLDEREEIQGGDIIEYDE
jgi:Zn-dependent peptidase ImmA (M78 family)/transcriptional regulator with XRE-family HTH domain